jgi:hypothetical protein
MRLKIGVALLTAALVPCVARAGDVKTDFDHAYDFGKVKTFATKVGTSWGNPLSEKRVVTEIDQSLTEKGWKQAPEGTADALVVLHGAGEKQKTLNTFYSGILRRQGRRARRLVEGFPEWPAAGLPIEGGDATRP